MIYREIQIAFQEFLVNVSNSWFRENVSQFILIRVFIFCEFARDFRALIKTANTRGHEKYYQGNCKSFAGVFRI